MSVERVVRAIKEDVKNRIMCCLPSKTKPIDCGPGFQSSVNIFRHFFILGIQVRHCLRLRLDEYWNPVKPRTCQTYMRLACFRVIFSFSSISLASQGGGVKASHFIEPFNPWPQLEVISNEMSSAADVIDISSSDLHGIAPPKQSTQPATPCERSSSYVLRKHNPPLPSDVSFVYASARSTMSTDEIHKAMDTFKV
uniref:Uncharacterized protein n=1 Tax=Cannabis sativa TaxID=3483 RepID=A0A803PRM5_CANSA